MTSSSRGRPRITTPSRTLSVFFYKPAQRSQSPNDGWRWWVFVWVPVLVAVGVIAVESTNTFSARNTSGWLRPVFEHLFGHFKDAAWETLHHYIRKTGHFVGYGLVGLSFLRAWLYSLVKERPKPLLTWRLESCVLAVLSTAIVASCDEIHQAMLPSRTGRVADVLLDTAGAMTMCSMVWLACWAGRRRSASRSPTQHEVPPARR
jgi:VanZ family protein